MTQDLGFSLHPKDLKVPTSNFMEKLGTVPGNTQN